MTFNIDKLDKKYERPPSFDQILKMLVFMIIAMYLGIGIGRGTKTSSKIKEGTLKSDHILFFSSNDKREVSIVGQNSLYLFYVEKGDNILTISPIEQNIKKIIKIKVDDDNGRNE